LIRWESTLASVVKLGQFEREHKLCKSVISFSLSELKRDYDSDYLGDKEYYRYLDCPACGARMRFSDHGQI
jgi:hypothetical protein